MLWLVQIASAAPLNPATYTELVSTLDPAGPVTVDTDALTWDDPKGGQLFTGVNVSGVAVFAFGDAVIDEDVTVSGSRPVAILATGTLDVTATIRAAAVGMNPGPGGSAGTAVPGDPGAGLGAPVTAMYGGAGAGHGGAGGAAGYFDVTPSIDEGGLEHGDLFSDLTAGSSGGCMGTGASGAGGGGIELGALGLLTISGTVDVSGGHGDDASDSGGGGGSGGGILLHGAWGSSCDGGALLAAGGDGGNGAGLVGGGGGGGGRLLLLGVDDIACTVIHGGGAFGSGGLWDAGPSAGGTIGTYLDPDADADGYGLSTDCNDLDPAIRPDAIEVPCNGVEEDCDLGTPDFDDADGDGVCITDDLCEGDDATGDADSDGTCDDLDACFGADNSGDADGDGACALDLFGAVYDCDDEQVTTYPGAAELCDGLDNDCQDGLGVDELDADGDGVMACDGDCDDGNSSVSPDLPEIACNTVDDDCDAATLDDDDADGDGQSVCDGDCDDDDPTLTECDGSGRSTDDEKPEEPNGCDCDAAGGGASWVWVTALGALALRRRRSV